jgi:hypothetical protein
MSCVQMIDEAKRITGVDFRDQMVKFFTSEIVDKILNDNSATRAIVEEAMQSNVNSNYAMLMFLVSLQFYTVDSRGSHLHGWNLH